MSKSTLGIAAIPTQFYSAIPAGIYTSPQTITIDQYGRISSISTGTGYVKLDSILTNSTMNASTSTGSVVVSMGIITATSYTISNIGSITVDAYGRITQITTATLFNAPGTYNTNNLKSLTINSNGIATSVITGTSISVVSSNDTVFFNNVSVSGLLTNYPSTERSTTSTNGNIVLDVTNSSWIDGPVFTSAGTWSFSLINVPLVTGRTLTTSVRIRGWNVSNVNNNIININGTNSPLYWLDITGNSVTGTNAIIASFTTIYNGSTFSTYASISPY